MLIADLKKSLREFLIEERNLPKLNSVLYKPFTAVEFNDGLIHPSRGSLEQILLRELQNALLAVLHMLNYCL